MGAGLTNVLVAWLLASASGCEGATNELIVDLRTDVTPGVEFDLVETSILGTERRVTHGVVAGADYATGVRVAEIGDLAGGATSVVVRLFLRDNTVMARPIRVDVDGVTGITVVATRNCRGVSCEDRVAEACLDGRCISSECSPENPGACPSDAECTTDTDCVASAACTTTQCESGACLQIANTSSCSGDQVCSPELGCVDGPAPFTMVTDLAALVPTADRLDDPALPSDQLELFVNVVDAEGEGDIYVSRRSSVSDVWPEATLVAELSDPSTQETELVITGDGLEIHFMREDVLYVSTRPDRVSPWTTPVPAAVPEAFPVETEPVYLSSDGSRMLISPPLMGLVRTDRGSPWTFGDLSGEVTVFKELARELTLDVDENRAVMQIGGVLYEAHRPSSAEPWSPALPNGGLESGAFLSDPWLSDDGSTIYYARGRAGEGTILMATR